MNGQGAFFNNPDPNPFQPTDRELYFGDRLKVSIPQIVKLNRTYGREVVLDAMSQLHAFPPLVPVKDPYAWLQTVASFKARMGLTPPASPEPS